MKVHHAFLTALGGLLFGGMQVGVAHEFSEEYRADQISYLEQNWTEDERKQFYFSPQGSYLLPYAWFLALEQPHSKQPFNSPKNISRLGYLPDDEAYTASNPDGLPVGFAREPVENGEAWLGFTCAACHTGEVRYDGKTIRIDGAPAMGDFTRFNLQLIDALQSTLDQRRKFARFARAVLPHPTADAKAALRKQMADHLVSFSGFMQRSAPHTPYGFGRVDAFGIIMNEVFGTDLHQPGNIKVPDAPVSYPFLWDTPRLDFVQWNGSAFNPFGRNVGEVLGTFGHVNLTDATERFGKTTARPRELFELERLVAKLAAPKWPEALLGEIDQEKARRGRHLYSRANDGEPSCEACHSLPDASGQYPLTPAAENRFGVQFIKTEMTGLGDIGTDPLMALNFATRMASTGGLGPMLPAPFTGQAALPAPVLLSILVGVAVNDSIGQAQPPFSGPETLELIGYRQTPDGVPPYRPKNLAAYKARPLDGIWATAPYLHNGSVASLYELLLPPAERRAEFYVGSHEFDAEQVGFKSCHGERSTRLDTRLPGNSNSGHDYGTDLSEDQRWDLIEFMKTL